MVLMRAAEQSKCSSEQRTVPLKRCCLYYVNLILAKKNVNSTCNCWWLCPTDQSQHQDVGGHQLIKPGVTFDFVPPCLLTKSLDAQSSFFLGATVPADFPRALTLSKPPVEKVVLDTCRLCQSSQSSGHLFCSLHCSNVAYKSPLITSASPGC